MFNKISKYLIVILLPSLILGTFLANLIITLLIIIFLISLVKEKKYTYFQNRYSLFFTIFYLIIICASLFSDDVLISLESSLFYFRFYLLSLSIWYFLEKDASIINLFNKVFSLTILALVIYALYQSFFFLIENKIDFRISSFFGDEQILGSYISRTYLILFALIIYLNKKSNLKLLLILIVLFIASLIGVLLSGERTAVLYFGLSIILIYFGLHNIKLIYRLYSLIFFSFIVFGTLFLRPELQNRLLENLTLNKILNENYLFIFHNIHKNYFEGAIAMFKDNIILGIGPKLFRLKCEFYNIECSTHPHNSYLQLLSEAGILGFFFISSVFIFVCYNLGKIILSFNNLNNKNLVNLFFYTVFFINLFPFVQNGNFFGSILSTIYFFPIGFYLFINNKKGEE